MWDVVWRLPLFLLLHINKFSPVSKFVDTSIMSRHNHPPAAANCRRRDRLFWLTSTLTAPDSENYAFSSSSFALPISRINVEETVSDKLAFVSKDAEALDMEASLSKKVGRGRTKNIYGQGVATREERP